MSHASITFHSKLRILDRCHRSGQYPSHTFFWRCPERFRTVLFDWIVEMLTLTHLALVKLIFFSGMNVRCRKWWDEDGPISVLDISGSLSRITLSVMFRSRDGTVQMGQPAAPFRFDFWTKLTSFKCIVQETRGRVHRRWTRLVGHENEQSSKANEER